MQTNAANVSIAAPTSHAPNVGLGALAPGADARRGAAPEGPAFWGEDGFGFDDLIDLINPLQHIPIISTIYRAITGDTIAPGPRMLGGALFGGGPIGAIAGLATGAINAGLEHDTGKDMGGHALAWVDPDGQDQPLTVAAAAARPAPRVIAEVEGLPWLLPEQAMAEEAVEMVVAALPPQAARPVLSEAQWQVLTGAQETESPLAAAAHGPGDVAAAMLRALDKYEALARARNGG